MNSCQEPRPDVNSRSGKAFTLTKRSLNTRALYRLRKFSLIRSKLGGVDTFIVTDEGGALREIEAAGATIRHPDRLLRHLVAAHGLAIVDGVIRSPQCHADAIALAVSLVANAS